MEFRGFSVYCKIICVVSFCGRGEREEGRGEGGRSGFRENEKDCVKVKETGKGQPGKDKDITTTFETG